MQFKRGLYFKSGLKSQNLSKFQKYACGFNFYRKDIIKNLRLA